MNPYSGLTDMFEAKDLLKKDGNSLVYTGAEGAIIKKFRKGWERNDDGCLDTIMADITAHPHLMGKSIIEDVTAEAIAD
jgi:hypothetical protein